MLNIINLNLNYRSAVEAPSRPKPKYTMLTSNLDTPHGIEFATSQSKEEFNEASKLIKSISTEEPLNNLRKSTLDKFDGIEEKESEYRNHYTQREFQASKENVTKKKKPNWYTWDEPRAIF